MSKTSMQILYDYIVKMEDTYRNMAKESKDKDFKKGVEAVITATTLIRVQMKDGGFQLEKEQIINAYSNGSNDRLHNTINDYYKERYQNK